MEWIGARDFLTDWWKKYRWAAVVLLAGVVMMLLPGKEPETAPAAAPDLQIPTLQQELEQILSRMEGAGKVKVLLTPARGEQTYYQQDTDHGLTDTGEDQKRQTVILTGADRGEQALVRRVDPPEYLGAVVICQGAGSAAVRLAVVDAVRTATGLSSDKISVLKMK